MPNELVIYHNPRCSKSRETLAILNELNQEPEIVKYLENIPSPKELKEILIKLHLPVESIIRKDELIYKERFKGKNFTQEEWLEILSENPKLIQRPIVIKGNKAVLGRPPENVRNLF